MHKFYWRNTHGPGARNQTEYHHYNPRLGKSGSADNILSEVENQFDFHHFKIHSAANNKCRQFNSISVVLLLCRCIC